MSRIGKEPVPIPNGVNVTLDGAALTVDGPRGELSWVVPAGINVSVEDGTVVVTRPDDERRSRELHGLTRSLIANMVTGVTEGYRRELEIQGVGYRVAKQGQSLRLQLGFSHDVDVDPPKGITFECPTNTRIVVEGANKQQVGQVAANIRKLRPPEPYKGKGIRYAGEVIRRKAGKAAG